MFTFFLGDVGTLVIIKKYLDNTINQGVTGSLHIRKNLDLATALIQYKMCKNVNMFYNDSSKVSVATL